MNFWHTAVWVAFSELLICLLAIIIAQVNPKETSNGIKIDAEYVITAQWSVDIDADVDLWVGVPPNGDPVFYSRRELNNVSLDHDNRGFIDSITILPDGTKIKAMTSKEMTTIRGKVPGRFDVAIVMFSFRKDGSMMNTTDVNTPVRIEIVKLNPKTNTIFTKDVTLHDVKEDINVVSFDLDKNGDIKFVDPPLEPVSERYYKSTSHPTQPYMLMTP